jgi:hypothetical protein
MVEGNLHLLAARLRTKIESLCIPQKETSSIDDKCSTKIRNSAETPTHRSHSHDLKIDQLTLQIHALERENGDMVTYARLIICRGFKIEM